MTAIAQQTDAFINAKPYRLATHHRSCRDPERVLSVKAKSTQNEPISNTLAKLVKAMPDMNKARSEKAIYGWFIPHKRTHLHSAKRRQMWTSAGHSVHLGQTRASAAHKISRKARWQDQKRSCPTG